jgi:phage repressor protein C with HTH and peptisase S24 domain
VAVVAAGVALAILLTGGDDDEKAATTTPAATTETVTTERTATERTETDGAGQDPAVERDKGRIERTVTTFVEAAEQSDSTRACAQVAGGAGKQVEDCAAAVGINLRQLPSSDELEVSSVTVTGDSGVAKLSNGSSFTVERSGGKWQITGFKPGPVSGG